MLQQDTVKYIALRGYIYEGVGHLSQDGSRGCRCLGTNRPCHASERSQVRDRTTGPSWARHSNRWDWGLPWESSGQDSGTFTALDLGSIPGRGTKIPWATWNRHNENKKVGLFLPHCREVIPRFHTTPGVAMCLIIGKAQSDSCENRTPGYQGPGAWISELQPTGWVSAIRDQKEDMHKSNTNLEGLAMTEV